MKTLILLLSILCGNPQDLRVQEAQAVVNIYEAKLMIAEIEHKQDQLAEEQAYRQWQRAKRARNAISEELLFEREFEYKHAELNSKKSEAHIKKAKGELEVVRIRLERSKNKDHSITPLN